MVIMNSIQISTPGIESKYHNLVNDSRHNSQPIYRPVTIVLIWLIELPMSVNRNRSRILNILPIFRYFIIDLTCSSKFSKNGSESSSGSHPCNILFIPINLLGGIKLSNDGFILVTSKLSKLKQNFTFSGQVEAYLSR
jgi:hypothetical protein